MDNLQALLSALTQDTLPLTLIKEAAGVFLAVLMAWVLAWMLGRRVSHPSVLFGEKVIEGLMFPLLALCFTYAAQTWLGKQQPLMLFKLALPVLLSLVLIRLFARVLKAVFPLSPAALLTERFISWLAWGLAVLWIKIGRAHV